jgi:hypothetical protein
MDIVPELDGKVRYTSANRREAEIFAHRALRFRQRPLKWLGSFVKATTITSEGRTSTVLPLSSLSEVQENLLARPTWHERLNEILHHPAPPCAHERRAMAFEAYCYLQSLMVAPVTGKEEIPIPEQPVASQPAVLSEH